MHFDQRRLVVLAVLAFLIAGSAVASRNTFGLSATSQVLGDRLLQPAIRADRKKLSTTDRLAPAALDPGLQSTAAAKPGRREFTVYRNALGEVVCREATADEIRERQQAEQKLSLKQINHFNLDKTVSGQTAEAANLIIVLRATQQLQQNADATAAFNRAAQNWENMIMSPITIYIDVDFGATDFGDPWPAMVLGATGSPSNSYQYQSVRANLIAQANGEGNATKQGIFNSMPPAAVPTDLGDAGGVDVSDSIARAIGLLPPTAQPTDDAAQIAFNSNFTFDFNPADGITANAIDFDAVATHEIGHALGFDSDAGMNLPRPAIWDLYRFRTGTTAATFPTAQRILTVGGSPDPLQYDFIPGNPELGLSNGGPAGSSANGADGSQSSHWKHVASCDGSIGIMDPAIPDGCRRTITSNDLLALTSFGYNLTNSNPPPPPPPSPTPPANDNFANAQVISGCSGTTAGSTVAATGEAGEPSHDPTDSTAHSPGHTIWYLWQAPAAASTTITTAGSDFDTILAVYSGSTLATLSQLTFNDDVQDGIIRTSSVTFSATAGAVYWIAVDGWNGDSGTVRLNWTASGCTSPPNPIDDASFFVKQHYLDFLNRQPDQSGWDFWTKQIALCGANAQCTEARRVDVSASFFLSIEFQNNGYLVERFYKVAYGNATGTSTSGGTHQLPVPVIRFSEFQQGTQRIGQGVIVLAAGWEQLLESNKQAFALEFVQTSRFVNLFPTSMPPAQFVDKLNQNAGNVLAPADRTTAINLFAGAADSTNPTARAQALRMVAENTDLYSAEYNRAFVLAEYFGYLRRNPNDTPDSDYTGYDFWLTKLNQFNGNYINAEMVKAFLSSIEYRQRFGP